MSTHCTRRRITCLPLRHTPEDKTTNCWTKQWFSCHCRADIMQLGVGIRISLANQTISIYCQTKANQIVHQKGQTLHHFTKIFLPPLWLADSIITLVAPDWLVGAVGVCLSVTHLPVWCRWSRCPSPPSARPLLRRSGSWPEPQSPLQQTGGDREAVRAG